MAQEETLVRNSVAALPTTQACLEVSFKFSALPNQSAKPEFNTSSVWVQTRGYLKLYNKARDYLKLMSKLDFIKHTT